MIPISRMTRAKHADGAHKAHNEIRTIYWKRTARGQLRSNSLFQIFINSTASLIHIGDFSDLHS